MKCIQDHFKTWIEFEETLRQLLEYGFVTCLLELWAPNAEARVQLPEGNHFSLSSCQEISAQGRWGKVEVLLCKLIGLNVWAQGEHLAFQLFRTASFSTVLPCLPTE